MNNDDKLVPFQWKDICIWTFSIQVTYWYIQLICECFQPGNEIPSSQLINVIKRDWLTFSTHRNFPPSDWGRWALRNLPSQVMRLYKEILQNTVFFSNGAVESMQNLTLNNNCEKQQTKAHKVSSLNTCFSAAPYSALGSARKSVASPWLFAISRNVSAVLTVAFRACTKTITWQLKKKLIYRLIFHSPTLKELYCCLTCHHKNCFLVM